MSAEAEAHYHYNQTIKLFPALAEPAFEDAAEQARVWGRVWGCSNDVGRLRVCLVHRPGDELRVVDPSRRIESIGSYGDLDAGWYWQNDTIPPLADMQAQHDALVAALRAEGVEIVYLDGVGGGRLKSCYTRDPVIAVKGGAVVGRMGPRVRRGEELAVTRTLAAAGVPVLRTINGAGLLEGGSFAWLNERTAVLGRSVRVNEVAARQLEEVLAAQGVELIRVDMTGYDIHIDGSFLMVDRALARVRAEGLPWWFLERLGTLGIRTIELNADDSSWIINGLAVGPGRVLAKTGTDQNGANLSPSA
jgi:N-dimethylarginine dimethylaminohydrolase